MKKFRVILALTLIVVLAVGLSLSAFAAPYSYVNNYDTLDEGSVFCNLHRNFTVLEKGADGSITIVINRDCSRMNLDNLEATVRPWLLPFQREILAGGSIYMLSDEQAEELFGGGKHVCLAFPADDNLWFYTSREDLIPPAPPAPTEPPTTPPPTVLPFV